MFFGIILVKHRATISVPFQNIKKVNRNPNLLHCNFWIYSPMLSNPKQSGNIFLLDYKNLDGLKANVINKKKQYMAAPLVLLYKTPDDKLIPIAIQVRLT